MPLCNKKGQKYSYAKRQKRKFQGNRFIQKCSQQSERNQEGEGSVPSQSEPVNLLNLSGEQHCLDAEEYKLEGRRVIDVGHFLQQLKEALDHGPFECQLKNLIFTGESRHGLKSEFKYSCNMCGVSGYISTDGAEKKMDINTAVVSGALSIGAGHSQVDELMATLDVPFMTNKTYIKYEDELHNNLLATAAEEMEAAAAEEASLAQESGDIDSDGVPLITVQADGSWAKRSYGTKYDSLSGMAVIIGCKTKKVLFMAVKNKYCVICARATNKETTPSEHACYKNWDGTSSGMEAAIILEGFQQSERMYGIRYSRIIADGDSSVYNKLIKMRPYKNRTIEKIECTNHILRNFCKKVRALCANKHNGPAKIRKMIESNIKRLRGAINKASFYWHKNNSKTLKEKIEHLRGDIINAPKHVFGEHTSCSQYFCKNISAGESNKVTLIIEAGIWDKLMEIIKYTAYHSKSLIHRLNSNLAENFNSQIAKVIGGKRLNFCLRGSYSARCLGAVISHNSKRLHTRLHQAMYKTSPCKRIKALELKKSKRIKKTGVKKSLFIQNKGTGDYGPLAEKPDMQEDDFNDAKELFLKNILLNQEEKKHLQEQTKEQGQSLRWHEERRKRLTASNFGPVCKRRKLSCAKFIKNLLYSPPLETPAVMYGKEKEQDAIQLLESLLDVKVSNCGLFIHDEYPFLGATPDGLIGEDTIVEVKCPYMLKQMKIDNAIQTGKLKFLKINKDGTQILGRNHNYYYQIQGQLEVTKRSSCIFCIYSPIGPTIKMETIKRDKKFWEENMVKKLSTFYHNYLLPELVDPRHTRSLPIREPSHHDEQH